MTTPWKLMEDAQKQSPDVTPRVRDVLLSIFLIAVGLVLVSVVLEMAV
jgi:hypothetical protein